MEVGEGSESVVSFYQEGQRRPVHKQAGGEDRFLHGEVSAKVPPPGSGDPEAGGDAAFHSSQLCHPSIDAWSGHSVCAGASRS